MIKYRVIYFIIYFFNFLFVEQSFANSYVSIYNQQQQRTCNLPEDVEVNVIGTSAKYKNFTVIRLPKKYHKQCGWVGMVQQIPPQDRDELLEGFGSEQTNESEFNNPEDQGSEIEGSVIENDKESNIEEELNLDLLQRMQEDLQSSPLNKNKKPHRLKRRSIIPRSETNQDELEAIGGEPCTDCQRQNREPIDELNTFSRKTYEKTSQRTCEAKGYVSGRFKGSINGNIQEILADYTERAKGAIRRGFLSIVPLVGTASYEKVRALTNNFQDFDSANPVILNKLLRHWNTDCYKFIKAALSGDYGVLNDYNRKRSGFRANINLVKRFCGLEAGDLTDKHWQNSSVSAGAAGPELEKRGFINLMNPKFGVSKQYNTNEKAPEGAVLVYQCAKNGKLLSTSKCWGDIAIKTKTGYLRDAFTPYSNTIRGHRVLVGVYIKPGGIE